jgi:hypothetical protein
MSPRRLRNNNLPGDRRGLAAIREAALGMLGRAWPDALATPVLIERTGAPKSSVRRALENLVVEGHVERLGRTWRAVRPAAPSSTAPRRGLPIRRIGLREWWLQHCASGKAQR